MVTGTWRRLASAVPRVNPTRQKTQHAARTEQVRTEDDRRRMKSDEHISRCSRRSLCRADVQSNSCGLAQSRKNFTREAPPPRAACGGGTDEARQVWETARLDQDTHKCV